MKIDSRGRVRFTYKGTRYEINKDGVLRAYQRGSVHRNSERARLVPVQPVGDFVGQYLLRSAINTANFRG